MSTELLESGEHGNVSVTRFYGDCGNCGERGPTYQVSTPIPNHHGQLPTGYGWVHLCAPCAEIPLEAIRKDAK